MHMEELNEDLRKDSAFLVVMIFFEFPHLSSICIIRKTEWGILAKQ